MLLSRTSWNAALVVLGGVVVLGAREVEADDAAVLVGDASSAISSELSGETLRMPQMMTFDSMPKLVLRLRAARRAPPRRRS